jgi:hypothetical protein
MTLARCSCLFLSLVAIAIASAIAKEKPEVGAAIQTAAVIAEIARQFDQHPLIFIGEQHRGAEQHAFLRALIRDPVFLCRTNDIVIEFGNARLQSIADAYVSGEPVTQAQLQSMWRETEVLFAWNSPVYQQFYETVREVNRKRVCPQPVRLLLGDPPIDWSKVKTVEDFKQVEDRDVFFADLVGREVLAKNRRALLISGVLHALRKLPESEGGGFSEPNAAQIIERKHPGTLFTVVSAPTRAGAEAIRMGPPPSFRVVRGSDLEQSDFGLIAPAWTAKQVVVKGKHEWELGAAKAWPPTGDVVDGVLYLGGDETRLFPSPKVYLDPVYQQQLRHRAAIIKEYNGQDFTPVLDDLVREARQAEKTK